MRIEKLLLDTNVLLLWLVANTDRRILKEFKRVQAFTDADIEILRDLLSRAAGFVTTPHVLTETSNFVGQSPQRYHALLIAEFKKFAQEIAEIYAPSRELVLRDEFHSLGLTDTALARLSHQTTILTTDYRLAGKITALGGNAINFNHYRANLIA